MSDELNHASIIDGIRLCKSKKYRYKHKDMDDLERMLVESQDCRGRLIVTDGVFSMDGNVCPLPDIKRLADKYKALIFIDECHATGFFGATGRGTEEFFNMEGSVVSRKGRLAFYIYHFDGSLLTNGDDQRFSIELRGLWVSL